MTSLITIKDQQEYFSAPSLQDICINFCVGNVRTTLLASTQVKKLRLRKSVNLPTNIWEKLLEKFDTLSDDYPALVYAVHHKFPALRKIHVRNCIHLKDDELRLIMEYFPTSLDIHNCPTLTKKAIDVINKYGKNLECLCIGTSTQILPTNIENWVSNHKEEDEQQGIRKIAKSISRFFKGKLGSGNDLTSTLHGLLITPKVRKLIIWGHHITQMQHVRTRVFEQNAMECANNAGSGDGDSDINAKITVDYWEYLTRDFVQNLEHLDLSSCQEILDLSFLLEAKHSLRNLHLHDVLLDYDQKTWGVLRNFSKLKFLDVSQYNELASVFANPDIILDKLVTSFPELVGLDISGTNLAGFEPTLSSNTCGIVGLASRQHNPLHFLGLLSTHYNAAGRPNIPALKIAGGNSIEQLLVALQLYTYRANILRKAIRILHDKLIHGNSEEFLPCYTILDILLEVMRIHIEDKHTAIVSLAATFHIFKKLMTGTNLQLCLFRINKAFNVAVKAMEVHSQDMSLLRNGVLNLLLLISHLNMNESYAMRLVPVLLRAGTLDAQNGFNGSDTFLMKAIAHMLYTVTHFEEAKLMNTLKDIAVPEQLCDFMDVLFKKRIFEQMPTFWILLLKFIADNKGNENPDHYIRFGDFPVVNLCFRLINVCNDDREIEDIHESIPSLREIQKPVLAFLINCLYNAPSTEMTIVKSLQIKQVIDIIEKNASADQQLLHVCCGFLAQVVSMKESYALISPTREEARAAIFRTMSFLCHTYKFNFTFRNLNQLYKLLEVQDAPEVHVWVLWTLVKLTESDQRFANMIIQDGKLNVATLLQQYSEAEDFQQCFPQLNFLCSSLSNVLNTSVR